MSPIGLDITVIQAAWAVLILTGPWLCWLGGRSVGVGGGRALLAVGASVVLAVAVAAQRGDEPLHTNGHAWREAREVLMPVGVRGHGLAPFLHGKGGISLQWLVADVERRLTGTVNPFRISRVAVAAAAGSSALLTIVLVRSAWAGAAAGAVLALMPLSRMLAVSGSVLAIPAWILPWSLALSLAAGTSGSRALVAGATLAAVLGTLSHTAMLAWPAGLAVAWALTARSEVRVSGASVAALLGIGAAWLAQLDNCWTMLVQRNEPGLLAEARRGFEVANLFVDPSWVSPVLAWLLLLWVVLGLRSQWWRTMVASVVPSAVVAVPFFAVTACSSDAVRYQGALLGLAVSLAVAGLWRVPLSAVLGDSGAAMLRVGVLASLVVLPLPSMQQPLDPAAVEHRLVLDAARRMSPGTLIILPSGRWDDGTILTDFPDFVLPAGSLVVMQDDSRVKQHRGPRLLYLGLACVSWNADRPESAAHPTGMRPECRALRDTATPWMVRSLEAEDIPRRGDGPWTFHRLSLDEPFGFFEP